MAKSTSGWQLAGRGERTAPSPVGLRLDPKIPRSGRERVFQAPGIPHPRSAA